MTATPNTWKCPGCGAPITLPRECARNGDTPPDKRLDQLAQALCGCWVVTMPEKGMVRLLAAILGGNRRSGKASAKDANGKSMVDQPSRS